MIPVNPLYCSGLFIEPLIHPKPGGVTRVVSHSDKSIYNFIVNNLLFCKSILEQPIIDRRDCIIGEAFRNIVANLRKYRLEINTSMGSWLLHVPIILSAEILGKSDVSSVKSLVDVSSQLVKSADSCDAKGYFELLRYYSPSHLGKLRKGGVDVNDYNKENLPSFYDVIRRASQTDIVHREIIRGYPASLEASNSINNYVRKGFNFEESVFQTILYLMSKHIDTLIARKYGITVAKKVLRMSKLVFEGDLEYSVMDSFMKSNKLNPGSILDIVSMGITFYFTSNLGSDFDEKAMIDLIQGR
ncbi:MAG: triphosphoribosyl-dephospho-CoA synthase [Desulfurococcales archaeon]|nr:triphosphoribosyl-dephospho-CoA synthase [Desulfurococcales archaeon]